MSCFLKFGKLMNLTGCPPKSIILETKLKELGFSKIQIDWVVEFIKSQNFYYVEVSEVGWFPLNSKYGFESNETLNNFSEVVLGSKYNVRIVFNYWEQGTKKEFRVLLVINHNKIINEKNNPDK